MEETPKEEVKIEEVPNTPAAPEPVKQLTATLQETKAIGSQIGLFQNPLINRIAMLAVVALLGGDVYTSRQSNLTVQDTRAQYETVEQRLASLEQQATSTATKLVTIEQLVQVTRSEQAFNSKDIINAIQDVLEYDDGLEKSEFSPPLIEVPAPIIEQPPSQPAEETPSPKKSWWKFW